VRAALPPKPLDEDRQKVVVGLGMGLKGKAKGVAKKPVVGLFKQAVVALPDEAEAEAEAAAAAEEAAAAAPKKEEEVLVDWDQLVCQLCKRKFKERAILQKHVDESELHRTNLAGWYATQ
jgi:hypothetical protein